MIGNIGMKMKIKKHIFIYLNSFRLYLNIILIKINYTFDLKYGRYEYLQ